MKKYVALTIVFAMVLSLTACGEAPSGYDAMNKKELLAAVRERDDEVTKLAVKVKELEQTMSGVFGEEHDSPNITEMQDGTGRLTFISADGLIRFPIPFRYPGSNQAPNTSSLVIVDRVTIVPANNWIIRQSGTQTEFYHPSGIQGSMIAGSISEVYPIRDLEETSFKEFFANLPPETVGYSRVYANDRWTGLQAMTQTRVNGELAFLRAGMIAVNDSSIVYTFIYTGAKDPTKDEIVHSLLSTMSMYSNQMRFEQ